MPADITPDMEAGERVRSVLLAGETATREAGIPLPEEQREIDAVRESHSDYAMDDANDGYDEGYSLGA